MKKVKNKKALAIAASVVGIAAIGGVIAYNQDAMFFNNLFNLGSDEVVYTEEFTAPTNWQPCEEVTKTFTVTNNNNHPVAVRFKYNEYWRTENSSYPATNHEDSDLSLTFDKNGTQSPIAVIGLTDTANTDWEVGTDGWIYYKTDLAAGATTSSYLATVTMDCDFSLVSSTINYSSDGLSGQSQPNDYANASYHIYITGQTIDAAGKDQWRPAPHVADCDDPNNNLLYDKIACASNGTDENLDFSTEATQSNGFGVNTLTSHANDVFPTYYYRGNVNNNYLIWADKCWRIVRTTDTGGVKLVYMGPQSNGQCSTVETYGMFGEIDDEQYTYDEIDEMIRFNSYNADIASGGYMRGYQTLSESYYEQGVPKNTTLYFGNDVSWDGSAYTLVDTVQGTTATAYNDSFTDHHYVCLNGQNSCTDVAYVMMYSTPDGMTYVLFHNGVTVETYEDTIFANTYDSNIKSKVDAWYGTNLASHANDLEDTVFCADRRFATGSLTGKDSEGGYWDYRGFYDGASPVVFEGYMRVANGTPSIDCAKTRDAFTVSPSKGNGALTYPIALLSNDEVGLAGGWPGSSYMNYTNGMSSSWLMTPGGLDNEGIENYYSLDGDGMMYLWYAGIPTFPSVSLKFGAKFTGVGTATNPYLVSF